MHYWREVLKVMEITGRNPSRNWEFFFLLRGLRPVMIHYLRNKVGVVDFENAQGLVIF